ncbi:MAG TPA: class I SAM-dependent methyltransferase [Turneriella sp.]|nr:class I SAM-dependent methyltransferase [Turneriella sp.]
MVEAGRGLGRPLLDDNFLTHNFGEQQFDLITHWATLEHLPDAKKFLQKMASLLAPEGKIYLSTCNTGYFARRYANAWRYLNVPEHVFYFNKKSLTHLAHSVSLKINRAFSYGSGFTAIENSNLYYRLRKRFFDQMARFLLSGDMIVIELTHGASAPFAQ